MKYARLSSEKIVIETFVPMQGFTIDQCFHPDIASQFIPVPDEVEQDWIQQSNGVFINQE